MNLRPLPIILLGLATSACDKAKELANKASTAVQKEIASQTDSSKGGAAAELQKLVDQTPEGVIFRKDLPFPITLEVRSTLREEISSRIHQVSAIDKRVVERKGTRVVITKLERSGDHVRHTLEQSTFTAPPIEGDEEASRVIVDPLSRMTATTKPTTFSRTGSSWKASSSDGFRSAVLSQQLSPVFDQLLVENALAPRSLWFGKRRFKAGDQITITGETLPMLLSGKATGSLVLAFEVTDAVEGHPCGVFSIKGDYSCKNSPNFEGELTDLDVSIQSGKIWLSLLYPIILKQEFDTIQSSKSAGQGGPSERAQGSIKLTHTRAWKAG
ncbi:MAG: hypothetical protein WEB53_01780 [Akkermansiaceae bacterium]